MQMSTNEQAMIKMYEAISLVNSLVSTAYDWSSSYEENVLTEEERAALDKAMKSLSDVHGYTLDILRSISRRSFDLVD